MNRTDPLSPPLRRPASNLRWLFLTILLFGMLLGGTTACGGGGHSHDGDADHHHGDDADHDHGTSEGDDHGHDHGEGSDHDHGDSGGDDHGHDHGEGSDHDHGDSGGDEHGHDHGDGDAWAITRWGDRYEVFAELPPLVAGEPSRSHTHVTVLEGFEPLLEGRVEAVLRDDRGRETVFEQTEALRPGIFDVEIEAATKGEVELLFRIAAAAGREEIVAGRATVVAAGETPGELQAPTDAITATGGDEEVELLKEQQWTTEFATAPVTEGELAAAVGGIGRVRPVAGGEVVLTAPVDSVLESSPWPYPGQGVSAGRALFRLAPRLAATASLAELAARRAALQAELAAAERRLERLQRLLTIEAVARREVEEVEAQVAALTARLAAARQDEATTASARRAGVGRASGELLTVTAPFAGSLAEVAVSPGEAVAGGQRLGRLVRTDPVWIDVELSPAEARRVRRSGDLSGVLLELSGDESVRIEEARLVSVAPEVDRDTGTVGALVEVSGFLPTGGAEESTLPLDLIAQVQLLLAEQLRGIVVPTSALVDDGGVWVVYLQSGGESFVRRPVTLVERRGDRALIEGLAVGERLVTRGAGMIRRASLMAAAPDHGHTH